ncbi:MAG: hypothetical protein K2Y27_33025 [Xanthobacteraceae bacterium]|nr:hypothetical protein [Xanthobacteraceae bacterium]
MLKVLSVIVGYLVGYATVLGLYFSLPAPRPTDWWHIALLTLLGVGFLGLAIWEAWSHLRSSPKKIRLEDKAKINRYMRDWIASGGRTVVFTRDMSWVSEGDTKSMLLEKAKRHELTICVEKMIPVAEELGCAGANVVMYGELGHVPRSRYTIVDFERDGARVAVGGVIGRHHIIQEFRIGEHPFFAVAEDLAKILIAFQRRVDAAPH